MKKKLNASSLILTILFIISAVVLVMFYCIGYGDMETININTLVSPRYTELLIVWMYILVGLCTLSVFVFAIINGIKNRRKRKNGERRNSWVAPVFLFMIVTIVLSYFFANDEPVRTGAVLFENATTLKMVDVCLYSIYILTAVALFCTILAMLGVFKSKK